MKIVKQLRAIAQAIRYVSGADPLPTKKVPDQPTGFGPMSDADSITIFWTPPKPEDDVKEYIIFRDREFRARIGSTPPVEAKFVDETVTPGVQYSYYIVAVNHRGLESYPSNIIFTQTM